MTHENRKLNSWKEIAAYLGRDVRTAQRWEAEGLPVHRLRHDKLATIYAHAGEIDDWLRSRSITPQPPAAGPAVAEPFSAAAPETIANPAPRRRPIYLTSALGVAAAICTIALAVIAFSTGLGSPRSRVADLSVGTASELLRSGDVDGAESLLRRILAQHPVDPIAEIYLAWVRLDENEPSAEAKALAERAVSHISGSTTTADEFFIKGSREHIHGNADAAIAYYKSALATAPSHYWSLNNLAAIYARLGYDPLAVELIARRADLLPHDGIEAVSAASALFQYGDYDGALRYGERGLRASNTNPYDRCWLRVMPAEIAWLRGDVRTAVALAEGALVMADVPSWQRDETARRAAEVLLLAGQPARARAALDKIQDAAVRRLELVVWGKAPGPDAFSAADLPARVYHHDAAYVAAAAQTYAGDLAPVVRAALERAADPLARHLLEARISQGRGDHAGALEHYTEVIAAGPTVHGMNPAMNGRPRVDTGLQFEGGFVAPVVQAILGAAECHLRAGRKADAVRLLEQLSSVRATALLAGAAGLSAWMRGQSLLADVQKAPRRDS